MIITKLEKQKKDKNRYNIFFDGEFAFGLCEDTILKFGMRTNDDITDSKLKEIKEYDEFNFGKKIAYAFLSYKQRSEKEIVKKLKLKKLPEVTIEKIINLLKEQKYIDDRAYAKHFLENKISRKPLGKRLLKQKLFEKGIDKEVADKMLRENYSEEKEIELAKELLKKYVKTVRHKNDTEKKSKCYRYLISRGFGYEIVGRVLSEGFLAESNGY